MDNDPISRVHPQLAVGLMPCHGKVFCVRHI